MSGPIKKVYVSCHEPIAVCRKYRQGWSDCYLRFKLGRKTIYKGPTLMCRKDVDGDAKRCEELQERYSDLHSEFLAQEREHLRILNRLNYQPIVVCNINDGCPDIYTAKDYIDRAEAEKMIAALMAEYGIAKFKQKWKHPGGLIVTPVSI